MDFLPMHTLGPHAKNNLVHFGILLPGITQQNGFKVAIRLIHELDQLIQSQQPVTKQLQHSLDPLYGDYWDTTVDLSLPGVGDHWGATGKYVYRYVVTTPNGNEIDWIIDPFAREFGVGKHAAFTYGYEKYIWKNSEKLWRTPQHSDLILYELNIMEFAGSLDNATEKLSYLQDLGINCISLMPITNISDTINWGYEPIGFFGVDERFGKRSDFQKFVDCAHQNGIAILVDAIYGHASRLFAYQYLYDHLPDIQNPMMGPFAEDMFSPSVDWKQKFAQDFFYSVNRHWLEVFHVDGFRYDCVPNYWELGPHFRGYAHIAYQTYQWTKAQVNQNNQNYMRFKGTNNRLRLIHCAEQLQDVAKVLEDTYTTCAWQNDTLSAAKKVQEGADGSLVDLGLKLGAFGLPETKTINSDHLYKAPLQYIENHDQKRFICNFGTTNPDKMTNPLFEEGDRSNWYKIQPYLIGVLMSKGIPLLHQGQELCENNSIAGDSLSRISFLRLVHWEHFYDIPGQKMLRLSRKLISIRKKGTHIKEGKYFYFDNYERYQAKGVLLFARYVPNTSQYSLVALNFTSSAKTVPFWFPLAGTFVEELHGDKNPNLHLVDVPAFTEFSLIVPSNYGRIWTHA